MGKRGAEWALVERSTAPTVFIAKPRKIVVTLLRDPENLPFDRYRGLCLTEKKPRRDSTVGSCITFFSTSRYNGYTGRFQRRKPDSRFTKTISAYSPLPGENVNEDFLRGTTIFLIITGKNNIEFIPCFKGMKLVKQIFGLRYLWRSDCKTMIKILLYLSR